MHDKIKEPAKENNDLISPSEGDSSDNPDQKALQFYFENRVKIKNLYNIAQTARAWLQSIFCGSSFVWDCQVSEPVRTKRPEDNHRYAIYKLPDINELVVVINYEGLWNSNSGEAYLRFYFEPSEPWNELVVNRETPIYARLDLHGMTSKNKDKKFWHCDNLDINIPEASLQNEEKLKDCIAQILLDPESRLVIKAR